MQAIQASLRAPVAACQKATSAPKAKAAPVATFRKQFLAAGASVGAMIASNPAMALVDDRLAGEGTGKILGVDSSAEAFAGLTVFGLVYTAYYLSTRELGGDEGDESGMSL
ncbi:unnamed protein product [Pedinophyceae sp. YPF-701]|nr:unnamed protein product [Pedinophyceae sp. YPF-701]